MSVIWELTQAYCDKYKNKRFADVTWFIKSVVTDMRAILSVTTAG